MAKLTIEQQQARLGIGGGKGNTAKGASPARPLVGKLPGSRSRTGWVYPGGFTVPPVDSKGELLYAGTQPLDPNSKRGVVLCRILRGEGTVKQLVAGIYDRHGNLWTDQHIREVMYLLARKNGVRLGVTPDGTVQAYRETVPNDPHAKVVLVGTEGKGKGGKGKGGKGKDTTPPAEDTTPVAS